MMEKVTAGATASLGKIKMTDTMLFDLSGMMEKVQVPQALGKIGFSGYNSCDLSAMGEKISS